MSRGSDVVFNDDAIRKLYKYRAFNDFTNSIITKRSLWYANPLTFNDPFDMNPSFRQKYSKREIKAHIKDFIKTSENTKNMPFEEQEKYRRDFENQSNTSEKFVAIRNRLFYEQISNTGVFSLSEFHDSILMWSHYADNHKGLLFEFDYTHQKKISLNEKPHKIDYVENYNILSHAALHAERREQMQTILLSKSINWAYEGEYRIIDFDFQGDKPFKKQLLTKIIFGLRASPEDMKNMVKLCRENGFAHVVFEKAEKIEGTFSLRMVPYVED